MIEGCITDIAFNHYSRSYVTVVGQSVGNWAEK